MTNKNEWSLFRNQLLEIFPEVDKQKLGELRQASGRGNLSTLGDGILEIINVDYSLKNFPPKKVPILLLNLKSKDVLADIGRKFVCQKQQSDHTCADIIESILGLLFSTGYGIEDISRWYRRLKLVKDSYEKSSRLSLSQELKPYMTKKELVVNEIENLDWSELGDILHLEEFFPEINIDDISFILEMKYKEKYFPINVIEKIGQAVRKGIIVMKIFENKSDIKNLTDEITKFLNFNSYITLSKDLGFCNIERKFLCLGLFTRIIGYLYMTFKDQRQISDWFFSFPENIKLLQE
jgi:hypothetical protein